MHGTGRLPTALSGQDRKEERRTLRGDHRALLDRVHRERVRRIGGAHQRIRVPAGLRLPEHLPVYILLIRSIRSRQGIQGEACGPDPGSGVLVAAHPADRSLRDRDLTGAVDRGHTDIRVLLTEDGAGQGQGRVLSTEEVLTRAAAQNSQFLAHPLHHLKLLIYRLKKIKPAFRRKENGK